MISTPGRLDDHCESWLCIVDWDWNLTWCFLRHRAGQNNLLSIHLFLKCNLCPMLIFLALNRPVLGVKAFLALKENSEMFQIFLSWDLQLCSYLRDLGNMTSHKASLKWTFDFLYSEQDFDTFLYCVIVLKLYADMNICFF